MSRFGLAGLFVLLIGNFADAESQRPNILVIVAMSDAIIVKTFLRRTSMLSQSRACNSPTAM
jgi:hypothetical protein